MAMHMRSVVAGVFYDKRDAQRAVDELRRAGFRNDQIGVAARDPDVRADVKQGTAGQDESHAVTGLAAGAAGGAGLGALWGLGIAAGVLPAIGPVIAGGTLVAILASAAAGAAAGGLVGALVGWGVPEEEARYYEREVQAGRILITVRAEDRANEALAILQNCNAHLEPYASAR
jgi:hypothetical protein